jgi:hypothetical protein
MNEASVSPQVCAVNATILLIALSPKSVTIPELRRLFRAAADQLCPFCRKFCGFGLIFGQTRNRRRITATLSPFHRRKCGRSVNAPVIKPLPESS